MRYVRYFISSVLERLGTAPECCGSCATRASSSVAGLEHTYVDCWSIETGSLQWHFFRIILPTTVYYLSAIAEPNPPVFCQNERKPGRLHYWSKILTSQIIDVRRRTTHHSKDLASKNSKQLLFLKYNIIYQSC